MTGKLGEEPSLEEAVAEVLKAADKLRAAVRGLIKFSEDCGAEGMKKHFEEVFKGCEL